MKIKVLIADDNSFIREGMKIILDSFEEFEVTGMAEDGKQAVDFCLRHEVDVALLDVRMSEMNGVEATKIIVEKTPTKPLILTTFDDDEFIIEAIRSGARGYLLKNNTPEQIRDAIKSVYKDHRVFQDVVLDRIKSNLLPLTDPEGDKPESGGDKIDLSGFTEREIAVMEQIAQGLSNKQIARKLFISDGTVANHITSILNKTGLEHRTQIAIYYLTGKVTTTGE